MAEFTTERFAAEMVGLRLDNYTDYVMKVKNTSDTEFPTGSGSANAQALTEGHSTGVDFARIAISGGGVFTALSGGWGSIDRVRFWFNSDADDVIITITTARTLNEDDTLTIGRINFAFT